MEIERKEGTDTECRTRKRPVHHRSPWVTQEGRRWRGRQAWAARTGRGQIFPASWVAGGSGLQRREARTPRASGWAYLTLPPAEENGGFLPPTIRCNWDPVPCAGAGLWGGGPRPHSQSQKWRGGPRKQPRLPTRVYSSRGFPGVG